MKKTLIFVALSAVWMVGCGGGGSAGGPEAASNLRSVVADYSLDNPVDVYFGDQLLANQQPAGFQTPYVQVPAGAKPVVYRDDVTQAVVAELTATPPLQTGRYFTSLTWGSDSGSSVLLLPDDREASAGKGKARFVHASAELGPVDVYVVPVGTDLTTVSPTFGNVQAGTYSAYAEYEPQNLDVWVTRSGQKDTVYGTYLPIEASQVRTVALVRNQAGNLWSIFLQDFN